MTIVDALQWANDKLKAAGHTHAPLLDAQVLLAYALEIPKHRLLTGLNDALSEHALQTFQELVLRRAEHEPVAYLIGEKEFYRRPFFVNRFTLIPRPATETLIDAATAAAELSPLEETLAADIGTGSGAIAITLAKETDLSVVATDLSGEAVTIARKNAERHGVEERVDIRVGDLIDPLTAIFETLVSQDPKPYTHLILCANLPYLTPMQVAAAEPDVREWEPVSALVSGADGLDHYWELTKRLALHRDIYPEHITLLLEIDPSQVLAIERVIRRSFPNANVEILKDLDGNDRIVKTEV